jgi:uncharacterized ferritin-like protein (DUF455 family)
MESRLPVAIGERWFRHFRQLEGRDAPMVEATARQNYNAPALRPPFNLEARRAAGFDADELADLIAGRSTGHP